MIKPRVALIPARSGSQRVRGKNIRALGGHPLIAYTIASALASEEFSAVIVSTDSPEIADIARRYGAEVPFLRPAEQAGPVSPDIDWVRDAFARLETLGRSYEVFSLLRPTSPFRSAETIQRAVRQFDSLDVDSLRAVELCRQHPGKMWTVTGGLLHPLLLQPSGGVPWHSTPYHALPKVYVQNASLEIAHRHVVDQGSISGERIAAFITEALEGFDINDEEDWFRAEWLVKQGATLPPVHVSAPAR